MIGRKVNRIIKVVIFLVILELMAFLIPVPKKITPFIQMIYIIFAGVISYGIYYLVYKYMIHSLKNRVNEAINRNDYDNAIKILENAVYKRPEILWIRMERAIFYGISGKLDRFWAEYNIMYKREPFCKKDNYYYNLIAIGDVLNFMNDTSTEIKLTKEYDSERIESNLNETILCMVRLMQSYQKDDMETVNHCVKLLEKQETWLSNEFLSFILTKTNERILEEKK
mgnify:CR=1 FL=1